MNDKQHLAQLNIGRFRYPTDDPRMADFMNNLDLVNSLAERSDGFVWRLKDESGNAMGMTVYDDPNVLPNLTVWKDVEALERFVWKTVHSRFFGRREEWFEGQLDLDFPLVARIVADVDLQAVGALDRILDIEDGGDFAAELRALIDADIAGGRVFGQNLQRRHAAVHPAEHDNRWPCPMDRRPGHHAENKFS